MYANLKLKLKFQHFFFLWSEFSSIADEFGNDFDNSLTNCETSDSLAQREEANFGSFFFSPSLFVNQVGNFWGSPKKLLFLGQIKVIAVTFDLHTSFHSRVGQRGGGLNSSAARSEHEVTEIIDGISEHEVSYRSEHGPLCPSVTVLEPD